MSLLSRRAYAINIGVMPPPPKFTRQALQEAAVGIVDERGLDALSMRSLAAALGTGPMTLYNYVRDREALDALVVEGVMAGAAWPEETGDWRADVRQVSAATWRALRAHPNALGLILARRTVHPSLLEPAEALLRALARGGRSGLDLLAAFRAVHGYIIGFAQIRGTGAPRGAADPSVERVQAMTSDRFPRLVEAAAAAARISLDEEFAAGLEVVIAGLGEG